MSEVRSLGNGMKVVLVPCEAESVAFGLFVASGSRHETERTAGISHFIEHMLFKGTPRRSPLDITLAIEGRGGNFNACTGEESTCYYAHLPKEYLGEAVDIIGDMYLNASIPEAEFEREKQVVIEEIRMYSDEPDSVAMENLQRSLFTKSRLGSPVAGSEKSLRPLVAQDLRDYIATHYLPTNTVAVVVGDFDPERAYGIVNRTLGGFKRQRKSIRIGKENVKAPTVGEVRAEREINQTQLAVGYRTFGLDHPLSYSASVLDGILGRGMSSRLFQEVREKRGLSYDISSRMQFFHEAGIFAVTGGTDPAKAEKALAVVDREIRRIREHRVSAAELRRVKEFLTGNFRLSHEKITSKLFFYGMTFLAFGRPVTPSEQVERLAAVSSDDVRAAAKAIFTPENRCVSMVVPKKR